MSDPPAARAGILFGLAPSLGRPTHHSDDPFLVARAPSLSLGVVAPWLTLVARAWSRRRSADRSTARSRSTSSLGRYCLNGLGPPSSLALPLSRSLTGDACIRQYYLTPHFRL